MDKIIKVVIAGLGDRGLNAYGEYMIKHPNQYQIVGVADPIKSKIDKIRKSTSIDEKYCYKTAEEMFQEEKIADIAFICTQDSAHLKHSVLAMEAGYDLILEKPLGTTLDESMKIYEKSIELGRKVFVCHVLRYTRFYKKIKEIIMSGKLGEVVNISAKENVGYYHQAHSYIRGNWRRKDISSPMIVAKCCHDTDIVSWLIGKRCTQISSFGSLMYFNNNRAPRGASKRCLDGCNAKKDCPYDAEKIYITNEVSGIRHGNLWPARAITNKELTEENVMEALLKGPYGRCVYYCDNDVVDHQVVMMEFENGACATLTMCGVTAEIKRDITVNCSLGEIVGDMDEQTLTITKFGQKPRTVDLSENVESHVGHGGGDYWLMHDMYTYLIGKDINNPSITSIKDSIHGHSIAFRSEDSRINNGRVIKIDI
ncbi:Gfo/Idh/MocA family protein [Vallitalea sp.]|jgi:predicted dehydrogenase|uniref:Gfo/Idh/MocA family protein n=1 Tax=Vallitalea sp. TaxID=1882829 RepID=UPI0025FDE922|nr:Gfo/Idh/MocA family oxidoreductase [Vallitalea sp.]MCT4687839.1 Gfo/Idh/MocA family oxidoreductase [Vallitalea sp.]